jgi:hypothetical protein
MFLKGFRIHGPVLLCYLIPDTMECFIPGRLACAKGAYPDSIEDDFPYNYDYDRNPIQRRHPIAPIPKNTCFFIMRYNHMSSGISSPSR